MLTLEEIEIKFKSVTSLYENRVTNIANYEKDLEFHNYSIDNDKQLSIDMKLNESNIKLARRAIKHCNEEFKDENTDVSIKDVVATMKLVNDVITIQHKLFKERLELKNKILEHPTIMKLQKSLAFEEAKKKVDGNYIAQLKKLVKGRKLLNPTSTIDKTLERYKANNDLHAEIARHKVTIKELDD